MDAWYDDRMPVDDTDGYPLKPLSASRLCELLDYATNYGRLHEELPDGTHPLNGREQREMKNQPNVQEATLRGSVMNVERRTAITVLKQALGILPVDLAGKERPKSWKIVAVDNYNRDEVADFLVADNITSELAGKQMVEALNEKDGPGGAYFYKLFPAEYRLSRGMEDLI